MQAVVQQDHLDEQQITLPFEDTQYYKHLIEPASDYKWTRSRVRRGPRPQPYQPNKTGEIHLGIKRNGKKLWNIKWNDTRYLLENVLRNAEDKNKWHILLSYNNPNLRWWVAFDFDRKGTTEDVEERFWRQVAAAQHGFTASGVEVIWYSSPGDLYKGETACKDGELRQGLYALVKLSEGVCPLILSGHLDLWKKSLGLADVESWPYHKNCFRLPFQQWMEVVDVDAQNRIITPLTPYDDTCPHRSFDDGVGRYESLRATSPDAFRKRVAVPASPVHEHLRNGGQALPGTASRPQSPRKPIRLLRPTITKEQGKRRLTASYTSQDTAQLREEPNTFVATIQSGLFNATLRACDGDPDFLRSILDQGNDILPKIRPDTSKTASSPTEKARFIGRLGEHHLKTYVTEDAFIESCRRASPIVAKWKADTERLEEATAEIQQQLADLVPASVLTRFSARLTRRLFHTYDPSKRSRKRPNRDAEDEERIREWKDWDIDAILYLVKKRTRLPYKQIQKVKRLFKYAQSHRGRVSCTILYDDDHAICDSPTDWFMIKAALSLAGVFGIIGEYDKKSHICRQWGFRDCFIRLVRDARRTRAMVLGVLERGVCRSNSSLYGRQNLPVTVSVGDSETLFPAEIRPKDNYFAFWHLN